MTTRSAAKGRLLKYALAKPDATLAHPWGENVAKVRGKVFVFFGLDDGKSDYVMGVKLTKALLYAKSLPYVEAMGYGLGKSGWVSVKRPKGALPNEMFEEWIDERAEDRGQQRGSESPRPTRSASRTRTSDVITK